jgi:hypothetical protein
VTDKADIPQGLLEFLYCQEGLTEHQIAEQLECNPSEVYRCLGAHGIQIRCPGSDRGADADQGMDWEPALAYAVGLLATRGSLRRRGNHEVTFESPDRGLHSILKRCLRSSTPIQAHPRMGGGETFFTTTLNDSRLHAFLLKIGFKSGSGETLGALAIPNDLFRDFMRGCIDGGGSVLSVRHNRHLYLRVVLFSYNIRFVSWIHASVTQLTRLQGELDRTSEGRWWLEYSHRQAIAILDWLYYSSPLPCLQRNRTSYEAYRVQQEAAA